ncbi:MAG: extracellular solute-binding protein, partial [Flexilinea sp.]|nr:extracellular solute-binding protein [Flexilinea sp.]
MKKLAVLLVFVMLFSVFCAAGAQEKSYLERAYDGEFKGTQVIFDGPFVDNDQVFFEESIKGFEEATGIDIVYVGNKDFESTIQMRVEGGNAPDIADFPQPGLLGNLAKKGYMIDV